MKQVDSTSTHPAQLKSSKAKRSLIPRYIFFMFAVIPLFIYLFITYDLSNFFHKCERRIRVNYFKVQRYASTLKETDLYHYIAQKCDILQARIDNITGVCIKSKKVMSVRDKVLEIQNMIHGRVVYWHDELLKKMRRLLGNK